MVLWFSVPYNHLTEQPSNHHTMADYMTLAISPIPTNFPRRRNVLRRMARFYQLSLQLALPLAELNSPRCDLIREWGRIGRAGTVRADAYPDIAAAAQAAARLERAKRRKGYR